MAMKKYEENKAKTKAEESGIRFYSSAEEQELSRLKEAVNRTDTEKFYHLMTLMKMQQLMKNAEHQPKA